MPAAKSPNFSVPRERSRDWVMAAATRSAAKPASRSRPCRCSELVLVVGGQRLEQGPALTCGEAIDHGGVHGLILPAPVGTAVRTVAQPTNLALDLTEC